MNVDYNIKYTDINLTTITDFQSYQYNIEIYDFQEKSEEVCIIIQGIISYLYYTFCDDNDKK